MSFSLRHNGIVDDTHKATISGESLFEDRQKSAQHSVSMEN